MDAEEVRRRVDVVIERQDEAIRKLQDAGRAFDRAVKGARVCLDGMRAANDAQMDAMASVRLGTQEALRILRGLPQ